MKGVFKLGLSIQDTKKLSKNYIFNCFFLISVKKGGAHKTKVLDSMLVFRCSPINSIELKSFSVPFLNKNVRNTGQRKCQKWPQFIFIIGQILMGDTSLSEAKYNYFRIFTLFYYICIHVPLSFHIYTQMEIQKYKSVMTLTVIYFEKVALYKFNSSASTFIQIYHDLS